MPITIGNIPVLSEERHKEVLENMQARLASMGVSAEVLAKANDRAIHHDGYGIGEAAKERIEAAPTLDQIKNICGIWGAKFPAFDPGPKTINRFFQITATYDASWVYRVALKLLNDSPPYLYPTEPHFKKLLDTPPFESILGN